MSAQTRPDMQPLFSVVIPTRRRPAQLARCLDAMTRLDFSRADFEIIVVNDDAEDSRVAAVVSPFRERLDLQLLAQKSAGPAAARNAGLVKARGVYVAFTGDDCAPAETWLAKLAKHFTGSPAAAFGGKILNARPENLCASASQLLMDYLYESLGSRGARARFFTPNNLAFPANALREMGGFNPALMTGEDRELCDRWQRAGRELHFADDAAVWHDHPQSLISFCRQHYAYGRGSAQYRRALSRESVGARNFEPVFFYLKLLRRPLNAGQATRRAVLQTGLMLLSQAANAVGFFHEWNRRSAAR
jgi:cellulose synthase/poly-beta-1,6-N-acetylglucosamine synthase-like glycosyltransferase